MGVGSSGLGVPWACVHLRRRRGVAGRVAFAPCAAFAAESASVPTPCVPPTAGLAGILASWLDEEWTPLPEHTALGAAAADAYVRLRSAGVDELSDVLLALSGELAPFDFRETFTNAFEVANKVRTLHCVPRLRPPV